MTVKTDNQRRTAKKASQRSKRTIVAPDYSKGLTPLQRREMEESLRWLNHERHKSWRYIAKFTIGLPHFGWLQRIASGKRDVKPKLFDLIAVRRLYDKLQEQADIDERRLSLSLRSMSLLGELNVTLSEIIKLS